MIGSMSLAELAHRGGGQLHGPDIRFAGLSTDTRTLHTGDVYLALTGARFDGNDFVAAAAESGASGAIVSRHAQDVSLSQLVVGDTHRTLGSIAAANRERSEARVIALTGSQGKTTVKEMIGRILALGAHTLLTEANLNNTIGVPLTLLRLTAEHRYAVIEMGANAAGEIAFSAGITRPDIALITGASAAHIEGFGSLQGIVQAKGEILDRLTADDKAILNADDANVGAWVERACRCPVVLFSLENADGEAAYFAQGIQSNDRGQVAFILHTPHGSVEIGLSLLGRHSVMNAVAAAACAMEAGAGLADIKAGLEAMQAVKGRLSPMAGPAGSRLIDDTYNASPGSFKAAIDVMLSLPGERILVAGDMKELGPDSVSCHEEVGRYARDAGVDELWAVGADSRHTVNAFGERGRHFGEQKELIEHCRARAGESVIFLIKGSRGAQMDRVVSALQARGDA